MKLKTTTKNVKLYNILFIEMNTIDVDGTNEKEVGSINYAC